MEDVDLRHAKGHLEELIARAARGEEVRMAQPGLATVRLTVVEGAAAVAQPERRPGRWNIPLTVPDDALSAPMSEEELPHWYGRDDETPPEHARLHLVA